jgi:hypothetical protein
MNPWTGDQPSQGQFIQRETLHKETSILMPQAGFKPRFHVFLQVQFYERHNTPKTTRRILRLADEGDALHVWSIAANISNK